LLFANGILLTLLSGISAFDYLLFLVASFIAAFALNRVGAFADGDLKFFVALSTFLFPSKLGFFTPIALFLASAALTLPLAVLVHLRELPAAFWESAKNTQTLLGNIFTGSFAAAALIQISYANPIAALGVTIVSLIARIPYFLGIPVFMLLFLFDPATGFKSFLLAFCVGALVSFSLIFFSASRKLLSTEVKVGNLKEGMVPAKSVFAGKVRGKKLVFLWEPSVSWVSANLRKIVSTGRLKPRGREIADCSDANGLSLKQVRELKRAGLKSILVRETIAFAPVLGVAAILLWLFSFA
jgi:hypothetical protein